MPTPESAQPEPRSAVADIVFARVDIAFNGSIDKAAKHIGISANTIRYANRQRQTAQTLENFAKLGIPLEQLEQAHAIDDAAAAGLEWPREIYDVVVKAMPLAPEDRKLLGEIATTIARHRARRAEQGD